MNLNQAREAQNWSLMSQTINQNGSEHYRKHFWMNSVCRCSKINTEWFLAKLVHVISVIIGYLTRKQLILIFFLNNKGWWDVYYCCWNILHKLENTNISWRLKIKSYVITDYLRFYYIISYFIQNNNIRIWIPQTSKTSATHIH